MTIILPPTEIRILDIKDGQAVIQKSVKEITVGSADCEEFAMGGYAAETAQVDLRSLWTRKETKQFRNFMQLRRKWENEVIPELKTELKQKLLAVYGTTDPQVFSQKLAVEMQNDPRLLIATRRGTVCTTVETQKNFMACKASGPDGAVTK